MSPKLTPQPWKKLDRVFTADGWEFSRQNGSHRMYTKPGASRPLVLPAHDEVSVGVISTLLKTAEMSRDRYFALLDEE